MPTGKTSLSPAGNRPGPSESFDTSTVLGRSARHKAYRNIVFPLFLVSTIAYIDRVNIGYAALTMNTDLHFRPDVFGFGAGILFAGYLLFAVPGALIAERSGARLWLCLITVA